MRRLLSFCLIVLLICCTYSVSFATSDCNIEVKEMSLDDIRELFPEVEADIDRYMSIDYDTNIGNRNFSTTVRKTYNKIIDSTEYVLSIYQNGLISVSYSINDRSGSILCSCC